MPTTRLKEFLKDNRVAYQVIPHPLAFTAKSVAGVAHIPRREMAKTVVVKLDVRRHQKLTPWRHEN
jgi:Ala-tRNA(Pro) deacylase